MSGFTAQKDPSSLVDEVANAVRRYGPPLYSLFTTYTFNARWFAKELLPLLCGDSVQDALATGLQVICDRQHYRGHFGGPWVRHWPGQELFHPKTALLVFKDATVLFAGSANLTPRGHGEQIELMGTDTWDRKGLPSAMRTLCRRIGGRLVQELLKLQVLPTKKFVCSLEKPFENLFGKSPSDEIIVVSPFYDRAESAETQDLSFLNVFAKRLTPAQITVVAPILENTRDVSKGKQDVQVPAAFVNRWKGSLVLYGVNPDDHGGRALHAKVLAVRRGEEVSVLLGSANATLAGMQGRNIEAGWFGKIDKSDFWAWLKNGGLLKKRLDLATVNCVTPPVKPRLPACPVASVLLDETNDVLHVTRKQGVRPAVFLSYEGRRLDLVDSHVRAFRVSDDWHLTVKTNDMKRGWLVPIEVGGEIPGSRIGLAYTTDDPEALLSSLTGLPIADDEDAGGARTRKGKDRSASEPSTLGLYEKVRRLSDALAFARHAFAGYSRSKALGTVAHLVRVAKAHDPRTKGIADGERSWRYWVRTEVLRALKRAPDGRERRQATKAVLLLLRTGWASAAIQRALNVIRKELIG